MKKILVPCDFSESSMFALNFAIDIASVNNSEVTLLHVIELPVMHDTMLMPTLSLEEAFIKETKENALNKFEELKKANKDVGVVISAEVLFGPINSTICDYVDEQKMDLIVMGSHGASGLKEVFIGSNAEKVVRNSPVPVFTIKAKAEMKNIKMLIFPVALEWESEFLVKPIRMLQELFSEATIRIVYINTPGAFRRDENTLPHLERLAKEGGFVRYEIDVYNDLNEADGVQNYAERWHADAVLMATHGRRGLAHFLSGSLAEDVVNHIECPICTFKLR